MKMKNRGNNKKTVSTWEPKRYALNRRDLLKHNQNIVKNFINAIEIEVPTLANPNPCWIKKGWVTEKGYGRMQINIQDGDEIKKVGIAMHRAGYALQHGKIAKERDGCHLCQKKGCANPSHILPESHDFNMQDAQWSKEAFAGIEGEVEGVFPPIKFWDGFGLEKHDEIYEAFKKEMAGDREWQYIAPEIWLKLRTLKAGNSKIETTGGVSK